MTIQRRNTGTLAVGLLFLFGGAVHASQISYTLSPYNVIVSGNFTDGSSIGGGLAVGGIDNATASPIASNLRGEPLSAFGPSNATLVASRFTGRTQLAAGTFWVGNTGEEKYGNQYWAGDNSSYAITGLNSSNLNPDASAPVDFAAEFVRFASVSTALDQMAATAGDGCTYDGYYWTTCTVTQPGLNVIKLSSDALLHKGIDIVGVSSTSQVVIDVDGTAASLNGSNGFEIDGSSAVNGNGNNGLSSYVLFNFPQATQLTIDSVGGSILAPHAAVSTNGSGQMDGQLIAASYRNSGGSTTFQNLPYEGSLGRQYASSLGSASTPEPGSFVLLGSGLVLLAGVMRRRQNR